MADGSTFPTERPRVDITPGLDVCASRQITREDVLARYDVDIEAGKVYWRSGSKMRWRDVSGEAGCVRAPKTKGAKPYWIVKVKGVPIKRSRLVFLVAHGYQPEPTADHIDGNSLNDAISNIREASFAGNSRNRLVYSATRQGMMGTRLTRAGRYEARICFERKLHNLGTYATEIEAFAVYQTKRIELFGAFA